MVIAILIPVLFIPMIVIGMWAVKRRREADIRRIAAYRASPESHILNLRD
jgi:hypothetical protein